MQKITGVGGVFFKARDPKGLMEWYNQHLGLQFQHGFIQFIWADDPGSKDGSTTFAIFKEDAENFNPGEKPFMINFRVSDLRALLAELGEKGVTVSSEIQEYDFGRFGWLIDPEGNKIELWEPLDH
jgi:predicted enzyme related to lactoylglutathione lyase